MIGTRRDIMDSEWTTVKAWDYGKETCDTGWFWYCCVPGDGVLFRTMIGNLSQHSVIEHEDGTITVSPSILIGQSTGIKSWHGYLEHGVWREV